MKTLLDEALGYLERGWSVIPIVGGTKKAAGKWNVFQQRRATEASVRTWFADHTVTAIGVIFGAVSGGLACRDFDQQEAYHRWAAKHPQMAKTLPTVKTGRGFHVYFRAAVESFAKYGDGEYRGDSGHYCVLPPSIHSTGAKYEWTVPLPPGELPLIKPVAYGLHCGGTGKHLDDLPVKNGEARTGSGCNRGDRADRDDRADTVSPATPHMASVGSVTSVNSVTFDDELKRTAPTRTGQRQACLLRFARVLKSRPQYADRTAGQLEPLLREWHRLALPHVTTKEYDETRIDFIRVWERVRFPMGAGPTEELMKLAKTMQCPPECMHYSSGIRELCTLCAILQVINGNQPFFLACRKAADVLGLAHHESANRWLFLLRKDGLLIEVEKGKPGTRGRATRWRWTGSAVQLSFDDLPAF